MTNQTERVWLITGCSAGFGRELALAALDVGDRVMATARDPRRLTGLAAAGGDRVRTAALDVTDSDQVAAAVQRTVAEFGRIDVVVNNAGHGSVGAVEELTMAELRAVLDVMFFGAVEVTKAALPHLRRRGSGAIVQISSMGGQLSMPGFGAYCAAKFALEGLSEALAAEVRPFGVRVVIVEPGAFRTEFGGSRMHRSAAIDAYAASVGPTRAAVDAMDGTQPGDPAKAARAILTALDHPEPPLRLALGSDAVDAIAAHQEWLRAELTGWEKLSRSTDRG
ncbi:NAD(P)-dependent dehydrogenase (short-subunit alcohol dehydrogenase family) [Actinoplanes octamycinicus]|uniref:NAD(P)-dependent dehydrogenase (Short-subunit alcohol dehydrogenase family) n=1 Tax=Actinoplanes octamycinicus TaxID=135948 RepID=A0A7W7H553_9ACTN|nr:oxidoreductase [Actinoplanes octamycinicus]MBB4744215.1 NAD(P)-dependent dehydrogenase (short-subunit alcohol dehydrogenase family) [Actinoplanes octamycinicus]GIE56826.1 short-chain dehydrogenase/reductase [Actinoplanes octamycinicus]